MTTIQWLDLAKARLGLRSDYALAKVLQVTPQAISALRARGDVMSDAVAIRLAHALNDPTMPPEYVLACVGAERARDDSTRAFWLEWARKLGGAAAAVALAWIAVQFAQGPADANALVSHAFAWFAAVLPTTHYAKIE